MIKPNTSLGVVPCTFRMSRQRLLVVCVCIVLHFILLAIINSLSFILLQLRLMQSELSVEEVIQRRTVKVIFTYDKIIFLVSSAM